MARDHLKEGLPPLERQRARARASRVRRVPAEAGRRVRGTSAQGRRVHRLPALRKGEIGYPVKLDINPFPNGIMSHDERQAFGIDRSAFFVGKGDGTYDLYIRLQDPDRYVP